MSGRRARVLPVVLLSLLGLDNEVALVAPAAVPTLPAPTPRPFWP